MIRSISVSKDNKIDYNLPIKKLQSNETKWYWIDFESATNEEKEVLNYYNLHPLVIEDMGPSMERSKIDIHKNYIFIVLHALEKESLSAIELDLVIGKNYIITYRHQNIMFIEKLWNKIIKEKDILDKNTSYICYRVLKELVNDYFDPLEEVEEKVDELDEELFNNPDKDYISEIFQVRKNISIIRREVNVMRDMMYRMISMGSIYNFQENKTYFMDIYDQLLKLSDMVESNREMTLDIREGYLSINANKLNRIMMILTSITTIFIPLTFIAGVYGMNFNEMPGTSSKAGFMCVIVVMLLIGIFMTIWFRKKGWLK